MQGMQARNVCFSNKGTAERGLLTTATHLAGMSATSTTTTIATAGKHVRRQRTYHKRWRSPCQVCEASKSV